MKANQEARFDSKGRISWKFSKNEPNAKKIKSKEIFLPIKLFVCFSNSLDLEEPILEMDSKSKRILLEIPENWLVRNNGKKTKKSIIKNLFHSTKKGDLDPQEPSSFRLLPLY